MRQKSLAVQLPEQTNFENFYVNLTLLPLVNFLKTLDAQQEKFIYLQGAPGSGVTHLLKACTEFYKPSIYLSMKKENWPTLFLENLPFIIALDDIDKLDGNLVQEKNIFNLYNHIFNQSQSTLILAGGHQALAQINFSLADLKSRLQSFLILPVIALSDAEKICALQQRANLKGFELTVEAATYLLTHFPRDSHYLFQSLEKLDTVSLEEKRKLTIPFIKKVLLI